MVVLMRGLCDGVTAITMSKFESEKFLQLIEKYKVILDVDKLFCETDRKLMHTFRFRFCLQYLLSWCSWPKIVWWINTTCRAFTVARLVLHPSAKSYHWILLKNILTLNIYCKVQYTVWYNVLDCDMVT